MNLGFIRQYLGEAPPERTFTAKELWEVFNAFAPLMSEEQEKKIVESLKSLLDTHTVKEENLCVNCEKKEAIVGLLCDYCRSEGWKEEPTILQKEEFCYRDECPIKKMHKYSEAGCIGLPSTEEPTTPEKEGNCPGTRYLIDHSFQSYNGVPEFCSACGTLKIATPEKKCQDISSPWITTEAAMYMLKDCVFLKHLQSLPEKKCCRYCGFN